MADQVFDFSSFKPRFWQLATDQKGQAGFVVSDLEEIAQAILLICTTKKTSDPGRPGFGCDVLHRIDSPATPQDLAKATLEIRQAIQVWEPRAIVKRVWYEYDASQSHVIYNVDWVPVSNQLLTINTAIKFPTLNGSFYSSTPSTTLANGVFNPVSQAVTTTSTGWQVSIQKYGKIVQGLADLSQAIILILTTKKGTDPSRPGFGCGLFDYIDSPINVAAPAIVAEIMAALKLWETRISVKKIIWEFVSNSSKFDTLQFQVFWSLAGGDLPNGTSSIILGPDPEELGPDPMRKILVTTTDLYPILTSAGEKILIT